MITIYEYLNYLVFFPVYILHSSFVWRIETLFAPGKCGHVRFGLDILV
jgi:hypothetical protein